MTMDEPDMEQIVIKDNESLSTAIIRAIERLEARRKLSTPAQIKPGHRSKSGRVCGCPKAEAR